METVAKLTSLGIVIILAALAANWGEDLAFRVNALVVLILASVGFLWMMRAGPKKAATDSAMLPDTGYMDDVIRAGCIATALWGVVGFLAGTYIAFQLAFPALNWDLSFTSFGRLRPPQPRPS